jgi:hypothetical protein
MASATLVRRFRIVLILFIAGLVFSGITSLPLKTEAGILNRWVGRIPLLQGTQIPAWFDTVNSGLADTYAHYPWMAYGTDWLAFGHFAIAFFFIGALCRPRQSRIVIQAGVAACIAVIPIALICGAIRGIPLWWRLIDCSFGVLGMLPLIYCVRLVRQIEQGSAPNE